MDDDSAENFEPGELDLGNTSSPSSTLSSTLSSPRGFISVGIAFTLPDRSHPFGGTSGEPRERMATLSLEVAALLLEVAALLLSLVELLEDFETVVSPFAALSAIVG